MKKKKILYIQPFETYSGHPPIFSISFPRISNYLNFKEHQLDGKIEEEYLDLRFEKLPKYTPENIINYRTALKDLLCKIYKRFNFEIVAISCLTSFTYLNCIEVASMIKHYINPSSYIVVGGFHASGIPEDFFPENIPKYFNKFYPMNTTPIDYLIIDEAEEPFFNFIKKVFNETIEVRKNLKNLPIIMDTKILKNLDYLPVINLDIYKKYKDVINRYGLICLEFNRGCPYRCKFCPVSESYMNSYRILRFKSIKKCIDEIRAIIDTKWLSLKTISIVDAIFFPNRNLRDKFFNELEILSNQTKISIKFNINDRIDLCSMKDLENYKRFNIIPNMGFESGSIKLLCEMFKPFTKDNQNNEEKSLNFLNKAVEIIKRSNELELPIIFYYLIGVPGTDHHTIKQNRIFLFNPRYEGKALIEKYKVNFHFSKYSLLFGSVIYDKGEEIYQARYYYKEWWKLFDNDQALYSTIVRPSAHLSFPDLIESALEDIKKIFKAQIKLKNPYYSPIKYYNFYKMFKKLLLLFKKLSLRHKIINYTYK